MARFKTLSVEQGKKSRIQRYPNFPVRKGAAIDRLPRFSENALLVQCGDRIYNVGGDHNGRRIYHNMAN